MLQIYICSVCVAKLAISVILLQQHFYNNLVVYLQHICAILIVANHCYAKYVANNIENLQQFNIAIL